jgi:hypothetical protein
MASFRRNVVLTDANYHWATQQAPNERALSQFINNLLQKERTLGPIETRMPRQTDRLHGIIDQLTGRNTHGV